MSSSNNVIDLEKAFHAKIREIQHDLNAPKSEWNSFAKYKYRTCEGILEAVKPLLLKCQLDIKIDDEITYIGNRHYVKSTATLTDGQFKVSATSSAREPEQKKGFDESQLTGATTLYINLCNCLILICSIQHQKQVNLWTKNSCRLWLTNWPKSQNP